MWYGYFASVQIRVHILLLFCYRFWATSSNMKNLMQIDKC